MVDIVDLTKKYNSFTALDHVNIHIDKGEVFGFVGPNGAGKTTTMRIMCGLIAPTSGSVIIDGIDARKRPAELKRKIGYVPDFFGVYDNLKVMEYMFFYGSMYGMTRTEIENTSEELLEIVGLSDKMDEYVDCLSRGMKQRLCVARALIHNPELLILDEPNSGLDPRSRVEMRDVIKRLSKSGKTIIISSHILPEISEMCTSIGVIDRGNMMFCGSVEDFISRESAMSPIKIKAYMLGMDKEKTLRKVSVIVKERFGVDRINMSGNDIYIYYKGDREKDSEMLRCLIDNGVHVHQFYREEQNLESMFLEITGGDDHGKNP
ncbi:MAG: ABC transporter ATP-binding protein [Coprococcus sp.]|nr:ABC transporter ATP-binding protein [Coprococcus sp.]